MATAATVQPADSVAPATVQRYAPPPAQRGYSPAYDRLADRLIARGIPVAMADEIRRSPILQPRGQGLFRWTGPCGGVQFCDPALVLSWEGFFNINWEVYESADGKAMWRCSFRWSND